MKSHRAKYVWLHIVKVWPVADVEALRSLWLTLQVAALHLPKLGAKLTVLSDSQAAYINVPKTGPFKPAHYRY